MISGAQAERCDNCIYPEKGAHFSWVLCAVFPNLGAYLGAHFVRCEEIGKQKAHNFDE